MKQSHIIVLVLVISSVLLIEACSCGCGSNNEDNVVKGYIGVVINEPFSRLAVKTDDNKTYLLQCSKELHDELWRNQGNRYYIQYGDTRKEGDLTVLVVEKVIPIKSENKTN